MGRRFVLVLSVLFAISAFSDSIGEVSAAEVSRNWSRDFGGKDFDRPPPRRDLLSHSHDDTALFAVRDGSIYLVELNSMKPLWSFNSGGPIYSSYQAAVNHDNDKDMSSGSGSDFFVDCVDDWSLLIHNGLGKRKVFQNIEECIGSTPYLVEDGVLVPGSKKTTGFLVDSKTGKVIHTYKMSDSPPTSQSNEERSIICDTSTEEHGNCSSMKEMIGELPLYITRTDYSLTSYAQNSNKVLWNLTVADFTAAFICQDIGNSFDGPISDSKPKSGVPFNMPLPCQSFTQVYCFCEDVVLPFSRSNSLPKPHQEDVMLPLQPKADAVLEYHERNKITTGAAPRLLLLSQVKPGESQEHSQSGLYMLLGQSGTFSLISSVIILTVFAAYSGYLLARKRNKLTPQHGNSDAVTESSMRNRTGNSGNFSSTVGETNKGRMVGKLFVTNKEIGKGSNGTVVFEGTYEGRPVAVKRLVKAHHDAALKEIQNLIASDTHPNVVRWYGVEHDQDFIYLSLERCICSLNDLIHVYKNSPENPIFNEGSDVESAMENSVHLDTIRDVVQDIKFWKENSYPSQVLVKLMRDVVRGLVHLHALGIVHRDLKPQNVLIVNERCLRAKLSDMGTSKRLVGDMSSLGHHASGNGSSGWQAPEQLLHGRQTLAVDLFSLGCVLFFCITGGGHPFGNHLERDINIVKNQVDLFLVEHIPEAVDLISRLLDPKAEMRPKAVDVLHHPLFWSSERRLSFLRDTSDRLELAYKENESNLLKAVERIGPTALDGRRWDEKMEQEFIYNIGNYRRYDFKSVRDLLRVIRNKLNHFREAPPNIQELLGSVPENFDGYFASKFPKLLIEVYRVMNKYCGEEEPFHKYFKTNITN